MSSFIIVVARNIDENYKKNFKVNLVNLARTLNLGVWFENRYKESFEYRYDNTTISNLIFSISDDFLFDNCEDLVTPWWYCDSNETMFKGNYTRIQQILEYCLNNCEYVELYLGTSGEDYDDFFHKEIALVDFIDTIKMHYKTSPTYIPPSVHLTIQRL